MRYLIVGPSWVGDMVMAQSLFKALKTQDALAEISVLAPAATFPLLERMPEVKEALLSPISHGKLNLREHYQMGVALRNRFEVAIVLPGSIKSALIPLFAKIPVRRGWLGEQRYGLLNDWRKLDKNKIPLMVDQYVALAADAQHVLQTHQLPALTVDTENLKRITEKFGLGFSGARRKPTLAFCPGAEYGPAKQWPAEHFAELARARIEKGWQVLILGGPKDIEIAANIEKLLSREQQDFCFNVTGKTRLLDAVDLLAQADAVVSNDSGLMHVSAALDRKLVVIYGSSTPQFTPPLSNKAKSVSLNLECSPCFERQCPLKHLNCLRQLSAQQVEQALAELA